MMAATLAFIATILTAITTFASMDSHSQTNNAPVSLLDEVAPFMKALDEKIAASRPTADMTDAEVVAQATENASAQMAKVGLGAVAAVGDFANKLVGAAANAIRKSDVSVKGSSSATNETDTTKGNASEIRLDDLQGKSDATGARRSKPDDSGGLIAIIIIAVLVVAAIFYSIAYARVKSGNMVVYSSWADFMFAAAWVVLLLIGYGCEYAATDGSASLLAAAKAFKWSGYASMAWMVGGAFLNRSLIDIVLAIPARIIVAILVLLALSKLKESIDECRNGRKGVVDGVLIPLGIALFVFNALVNPMVGDNRK